MLQFFRNNQLTTLPLIILYFLALHLGLFFQPIAMPNSVSDWNVLMQYAWHIIGWNSITMHIFWIVAILVQVFGLNALINYYKLSRRFTYITTLGVILTYSFLPHQAKAFPILLGNICIGFSIFNLFNAYVEKASNAPIFNATAWMTLAGFFYTPFFLFSIVLLLGMYTLRGYHLKENIVFVLGIIVPFILMSTIQFLMGNFEHWSKVELIDKWQFLEIAAFTNLSFQSIVSILAYVLVNFWLWSISWRLEQKTTLQEKSYINILYIALLIGALSLPISGTVEIYKLMILATPMSLLLGLGLQAIQSNRIAEIWHWFLIGLALLVQYQFIF